MVKPALTEHDKDEITQMYTACYREIHTIPGQRLTIQSLFLTVNTAVSSFLGYLWVFQSDRLLTWNPAELLLALVVMYLFLAALCYIWFRLLREYDELSYSFIMLIKGMEKHLPVRPLTLLFQATDKLGINTNLGALTNIIPCLFLTMYSMVFIYLMINHLI